MRYTQITDDQVRQMLDTIGVASVDELFTTVPSSHRLKEPLSIPRGVSESEILGDVGQLARRNHSCDELVCFLGGGAYDHFIPALVDAVSSQTEFLTAYTPYQAEASQGMLQLFYEFQTMICELFGMDVANASLYEGSTAAAEAVAMGLNVTGRRRVMVAKTVHPDTQAVLQTYLREQQVEVVTIPARDGTLKVDDVRQTLTDDTAVLLLQSPNFFGCLERMDQLIPLAQKCGALCIVSTDPLAGGLLKPPGMFGADIVVGEGQGLGVPLQYGGPYLGLLACKQQYLRKVPGRVVGATTDREGRRGFCLALQTREQHIRRENATSNVCTNQGLLAVRASVYMAAMGKQGIAEVASQCFDKAHYAAKRIADLSGFEMHFDAPFFKEFVVRSKKKDVSTILATCRNRGILGGIPLVQFDERLSDCFLVAVTEKRTKREIDALVEALEAS